MPKSEIYTFPAALGRTQAVLYDFLNGPDIGGPTDQEIGIVAFHLEQRGTVTRRKAAVFNDNAARTEFSADDLIRAKTVIEHLPLDPSDEDLVNKDRIISAIDERLEPKKFEERVIDAIGQIVDPALELPSTNDADRRISDDSPVQQTATQQPLLKDLAQAVRENPAHSIVAGGASAVGVVCFSAGGDIRIASLACFVTSVYNATGVFKDVISSRRSVRRKRKKSEKKL